jgi:hypothetical protein
LKRREGGGKEGAVYARDSGLVENYVASRKAVKAVKAVNIVNVVTTRPLCGLVAVKANV